MKITRNGFLAALPVLLSPLVASADVINVESAVAFQDEGTLEADQTAVVSFLDGNYGPIPTGSVVYDYYATGTSSRYFDAISLNFDLSSIGFGNVTGATLRFFTEKGSYPNLAWEHYQVLNGAFNIANQDAGAGGPGMIDFGGPGQLAADTAVGWLSSSINAAWITSDSFDVTLRLWNARIDRIELVVESVPEPATLALMGLGLAGIGVTGARRKRRT